MQVIRYVIPPECDGWTVQNFLRQRCGFSYRMIVRLKHECGGMTVNGETRRSIDPLWAGEELVLTAPEDEVRIEGADLPLAIVYEDEYLLVVDKPPYLAVHPSAGKPEPTLANAVVGHYQKQGVPLSFRPVNRLDRNTSGLLLAAKHPHIAFSLAQKPQKTYEAIALGYMEGNGVIDRPIRVKEGCCITREVGEGGKPSRTRYEVIAANDTASHLRLWLDTGRTHQIRVHLASLGHPLAGDTMYGNDETLMPRHALHCTTMTLTHPMTGESLSFESPLPDDMRQCLDSCGLL